MQHFMEAKKAPSVTALFVASTHCNKNTVAVLMSYMKGTIIFLLMYLSITDQLLIFKKYIL